jgi:Fe-S oxidoreductase
MKKKKRKKRKAKMTLDSSQTIENCNLCAICNLNCPIYIALLKESAGARFKAFLAKKKNYSDAFFLCTECGSCIKDCPAKIELRCLEIRKRLAELGKEPLTSKEMKENINKFGNPFGEVKKGKKIARYYT